MQVTFFGVEADVRALLRLADSQSLAVVPASYRIGEEPAPSAAKEHSKDEAPFLLLPREYSLDDVVYIEGSKGKRGTATVDLDESPVILLTPPVMWGTKLDAGAIEMADEAHARKFSLTLRRYNLLANLLRRWHRTDKDQGWVGPAAEKLVKEQRIQLGLGKRSVTLW